MRITDIHKMIVGYNGKTQHRGGILVPIMNDGLYGYNDYRYETYYVVDDVQNFVKTFRYDFEYEIEKYSVDYYLFFPFKEDCDNETLKKFMDRAYVDDVLMNILDEFTELIWDEDNNMRQYFDINHSRIFEPTLNKELIKAIEDIWYNF